MLQHVVRVGADAGGLVEIRPADGEKLTIAAVAKASDRKAAWGEVLKALAATDEAKKYAADLMKRNPPKP